MTNINALLVDDEISAIKTLRGMIEKYFPQINIIGIAHTVNDAYAKIIELAPDVVFLDIEMPPFGSGFDLLNRCGDYQFGVIFTTAYPKYAIQAINEKQPWAYLVKPFSVNHLSKAIETAEEKIKSAPKNRNPIFQNSRIVIPDARKGNVVIPIEDILYCKAGGAMADLFYLKNGEATTFTASRTLKDLEEQLPEKIFCRCHHSYLVNLIFIDRFEQTGRNGIIHLKNKTEIPISVSKMEIFTEQFYSFTSKK
jgi:two-component system LytT family response regulator